MKQLLIIGHLGQDAQLKEANGRKFLTFSVASSESYKDAQGNKVERTDWVSCTSEQLNLQPYLLKGTQVLVQGPNRVKVDKNRDGQWVAFENMRCDKIQLLGSAKPKDGQQAQGSQAEPALATAGGIDDEPLPF